MIALYQGIGEREMNLIEMIWIAVFVGSPHYELLS